MKKKLRWNDILKITFIGAGSLVFGRNVLTDLMAVPALRKDTLICLEDIDQKRLDIMYNYVMKYKECYSEELEGITFEKTTNQKKSVEDAKYIINAVNTGGLEAYKLDVEIPYKYHVDQCIGDTLGPGGVFRFLRTVPFFDSLLKDIIDVGYNIGTKGDQPILLNYANPMAMNTWYCNEIYPDSTVGLCHGVQGTAAFLSYCITEKIFGSTPENFSYFCAGINHMAWFLEFRYKNLDNPDPIWEDAYPIIKTFVKNNPEKVGHEKVRIDIMNATGYFCTESSGHSSEYLSWYRKRQDLLEKYSGASSGHSSLKYAEDYNMQVKNQGKMEDEFLRKMKRKKLPYKSVTSGEYAASIINAMETNQPCRFNGNVLNKKGSLIANLPKRCCVEVPIFADAHGLHPQGGIELPTICQALCISNVMVQKAAVEGALKLDKESIYHAILLDPNTASVCSPSEIRDMVDELFEAEAHYIPKFD